MKNKIKIMNLLVNGAPFNPSTYNRADNLDALMINGDDVANVRITFYCGSETTLVSSKEQTSVGFKQFIDEFDEGDYGCQNSFLISKYQEYLYPFLLSSDKRKDSEQFIDVHKLLDWCFRFLNEDDRVVILLTSFDLWKSKMIITKSEDVGVIVDYYDEVHDEPINSDTYFFADYEQELSEIN